jgi:putative IMPACT (imprinted ancient) family translation regulator
MECYQSVKQDYGPIEIREMGSRFIAFVYPVSSLSDAKVRIDLLKKRFNDASHVCFAYRLVRSIADHSEVEILSRYYDDGEPGGTAGLPIFNEIVRKEYHNVLVAVVRYFGGIKLGTGRLSRTYAAAAREILERTVQVECQMEKMAQIFFPFNLTGDLMQLIKQFSLKLVSQEYTADGVHLRLLVPVGIWDKFVPAVQNTSKGKAEIKLDLSDKILKNKNGFKD